MAVLLPGVHSAVGEATEGLWGGGVFGGGDGEGKGKHGIIDMCIKPMVKAFENLDGVDECLRGFYSNSFFHIFIDGDFNPIISKIASKKSKGTALHEYTHYIQNIGTLWGLYCSIQQYETIIEFKKAVIAADVIKRPFTFPLPEELRRKNEYINHGNGTKGYPNWNLNVYKPIDIERSEVSVAGKSMQQVDVSFILTNGSRQTVQLGAHIIKESMAALYQSLLDPGASHDDVPYNLVKLIAEKHFPETAKDVRKLICCCHTSLFSMSPGSCLLETLQEAEYDSPNLNGFELFSKFVHTKDVTTGKGQEKTIIEFFNDMVDRFKRMLVFNLVAPLDYIDTAMGRVRLDSQYYPFLSVLYEDDGVFSEDDFTEVISYYGIPYIQTSKYGIHYPQGSVGEGKVCSIDVLELIVQEALYRSFVDQRHTYCCPLYYMCQGTTLEKPECFSNPWEGGLCSYQIVSEALGLNKKIVF